MTRKIKHEGKAPIEFASLIKFMNKQEIEVKNLILLNMFTQRTGRDINDILMEWFDPLAEHIPECFYEERDFIICNGCNYCDECPDRVKA
jgi:hypothetical protein